MTDQVENIATRLARARLSFVDKADFKKTKTEGLKYAYLKIEDAKPLIEEVTANEGITIIPVDMEVDKDASYTFDKQSKYDGSITKWTYICGTVGFMMMGPEDSIAIKVKTEAMDNSDKAISKAYTAAYKNMVKIVFGFAESPKDDADATQEEIPAKSNRDPFFGKMAEPKPKPFKTTQEGDKADKERMMEKDNILNDITAYYFEPDKSSAAADIVNEELANFKADKLHNLNIEKLQHILGRIKREVD